MAHQAIGGPGLPQDAGRYEQAPSGWAHYLDRRGACTAQRGEEEGADGLEARCGGRHSSAKTPTFSLVYQADPPPECPKCYSILQNALTR